MIESASIMAKDTQIIHPLLPFAQSSTGPGAQPLCLAIGDKIAQPRTAPRSMCIEVEGPMIMPWPTYAGEGLRVHSQF
jgi:hypothetical protein